MAELRANSTTPLHPDVLASLQALRDKALKQKNEEAERRLHAEANEILDVCFGAIRNVLRVRHHMDPYPLHERPSPAATTATASATAQPSPAAEATAATASATTQPSATASATMQPSNAGATATAPAIAQQQPLSTAPLVKDLGP